jgi:hypothetical protein
MNKHIILVLYAASKMNEEIISNAIQDFISPISAINAGKNQHLTVAVKLNKISAVKFINLLIDVAANQLDPGNSYSINLSIIKNSITAFNMSAIYITDLPKYSYNLLNRLLDIYDENLDVYYGLFFNMLEYEVSTRDLNRYDEVIYQIFTKFLPILNHYYEVKSEAHIYSPFVLDLFTIMKNAPLIFELSNEDERISKFTRVRKAVIVFLNENPQLITEFKAMNQNGEIIFDSIRRKYYDDEYYGGEDDNDTENYDEEDIYPVVIKEEDEIDRDIIERSIQMDDILSQTAAKVRPRREIIEIDDDDEPPRKPLREIRLDADLLFNMLITESQWTEQDIESLKTNILDVYETGITSQLFARNIAANLALSIKSYHKGQYFAYKRKFDVRRFWSFFVLIQKLIPSDYGSYLCLYIVTEIYLISTNIKNPGHSSFLNNTHKNIMEQIFISKNTKQMMIDFDKHEYLKAFIAEISNVTQTALTQPMNYSGMCRLVYFLGKPQNRNPDIFTQKSKICIITMVRSFVENISRIHTMSVEAKKRGEYVSNFDTFKVTDYEKIGKMIINLYG